MRAFLSCLSCFILCLLALPCHAENFPRPVSAPPQKSATVVEPGNYIRTPSYKGNIVTPEGVFKLRERNKREISILLPDMKGDYLRIPGGSRPSHDPDFAEAMELKLKTRELVDQMLDTESNDSLKHIVALPISFVSLDNFSQTSSLGRYLSESIFYEFNQRGISTQEYRYPHSIATHPGEGEFALTRALSKIRGNNSWTTLILGTYYVDPHAVFVNARMVRSSDSMVLRTAQIILPMNGLIKRMLPQPVTPKQQVTVQPPLRTGSLRISQGRK